MTMLLDESGHYGGRPPRPSRLFARLNRLFSQSVSAGALVASANELNFRMFIL